MKKLILKLVIAIICSGLLFVNCKLSDIGPNQSHSNLPYQSEAVVTGYLFPPCSTLECGGLRVIIKNDTTKNPPPFYMIYSSFGQFGFNQSTQFPVNVSLDWKHDTSSVRPPNYIVVTRLKVDN